MKVINKKARFRYELLDRFEAGIVLTGAEVKSVREGHISLAEAYVRLHSEEIWLVNANISPYKFADNKDYDPTRTRKLLLHRQEIVSLTHKLASKNLVMVPTVIYTHGRRIKLEVALARPKKFWQKKEAIKRKDLDREAERVLGSINK